MASAHRPSSLLPVLVALALASSVAGWCVAVWGWSAEGTLRASRYTARLAFYWFIAAWAAGPLAHFWRGGWRAALLVNRRGIGLAFAATHGVHLLALASAIIVFGHPSGLVQLGVGGIAYLFVAAMAATSNDASVRWLGARRWQQLHTCGNWLIAFVFGASYAKSIAAKPAVALSGLALLAAVTVLRMARRWRRRDRASKSGREATA